jgi:beta-N-acetylhexosaminidase
MRRALLFLLCLGLGSVPGAFARGSAETLTLDQQVGQLVVLSFRGTTAPEYVLEALRERRAAGVILFGGNVVSPAQLSELTSSLLRAGGTPVIAVDQEGGRVRRVPWAGPVRSQRQQVAAGTVRSDATSAAHALRAVGINVTLAPVADVPGDEGAAMAARAFSGDPAVTGASVRAAIRGWRSGGIAAAAKHFPGIGGASRNTDAAVVRIRRSVDVLERIDLAPFRAAVAVGVPVVMVGHALYPALDRFRVASQSEPVIEGILRGDLRFRGVVMTDSMEARASLATGSLEDACERAVRAGADLLLLTGRASYRPVYDHLLAVARADPVLRARVRESAGRVLELKAGLR